jgi:hypothetical protein
MRLIDLKLLFIHVPRCGGTSINNMFVNYGFTNGVKMDYRIIDLKHLYGKVDYKGKTIELDHCTYQHLEIFCSPYELETFYKFAVVRDPVQRMVSVYKRAMHEHDFRILGSRNITSFSEFIDGLEWLQREGYFDIENVKELPHANISHFIPQYLYVCDRNNQIMVDNLINISNLQSGLDSVSKAIQCQPLLPKMANLSSDKVRIDHIEIHENINRLREIYKRDYKILEGL